MAGGGDNYDGLLMAELLDLGGAGEGFAAAAAADPLIPFFIRSRTIRLAVVFILWGVAGIIFGAVPELHIGLAHLILCFFFLMAGVTLLSLTMAAPRCAVAARAAAELENLLMAMIG